MGEIEKTWREALRHDTSWKILKNSNSALLCNEEGQQETELQKWIRQTEEFDAHIKEKA